MRERHGGVLRRRDLVEARHVRQGTWAWLPIPSVVGARGDDGPRDGRAHLHAIAHAPACEATQGGREGGVEGGLLGRIKRYEDVVRRLGDGRFTRRGRGGREL